MFPFTLMREGVLGINARNVDYLFPSNPRKLYKLADNKLETKRIAEELNVPIPETYGVISFQNEVGKLSEIIDGHDSFVVKPAQGSGGDGIEAITEVTDEGFKKPSGKILSKSDLQYHIHNILGGAFSLGGLGDKTIIEYAVQFDPVFDEITYQGVPDIRVIIYQGVPVMGMLRLPTKASDGKANLHRGGLGLGIDLNTGKTLTAIQNNRYIEKHPDTDATLTDREIPHWDTILDMAAKLCEKTEFGYLGIDVVLDEEKGPLLLEINARPGLSIQIANQSGLIPRLKTVESYVNKLSGIKEKIAFAKDKFAVSK